MERDDAVDEAAQFGEFVGRFIYECAYFEFAFVVEEVDAVHFAVAFTSTVTAVVADFKVFFAAALAPARFKAVAEVADSTLYWFTAHGCFSPKIVA
jgi:hypothetical protein